MEIKKGMISQLHTAGAQGQDREGELDWMVKYDAVSMDSSMCST